jgi:hypothetical protein
MLKWQVLNIEGPRGPQESLLLLGRPCCSNLSDRVLSRRRGAERRAAAAIRAWKSEGSSYPPCHKPPAPNQQRASPSPRFVNVNPGGTSGGVQKEWYNPDLLRMCLVRLQASQSRDRDKTSCKAPRRADLDRTCSCNRRPYRRNFDTDSDRVWLIQSPTRDPWRVVVLRYSLIATC